MSGSEATYFAHRFFRKHSRSWSFIVEGRCFSYMCSQVKSSVYPTVEDKVDGRQVNKHGVRPVNLAKHLACMPEELPNSVKTKVKRMKLGLQEYEKHTTFHGYKHMPNVLGCAAGNDCPSDEGSKKDYQPVSLAKSLACLQDESSILTKRKAHTRMELKRAIEMRIKKRVKQFYENGKFYHLIEKVIANVDTLQDSYDIIRLNSNVDLTTERDDIHFVSLAEQLRSGKFDIGANTISFYGKNVRKECLVLPNLKLRIIQEAIRVVLEIIYRPQFSKISHGCRSGRGRQSALRYICHEIGQTNWWFTLHMKKRADRNILFNLIDIMAERIEDAHLFSIIQCMFDAQVLNLEFGGFPKGQGHPQEGILSPILMNIYLHNLDSEIFRLFMRYEGICLDSSSAKGSSLRRWFRRQMKDNDSEGSGLRLHACRYMDELFITVSGSREIAHSLKNEIEKYLKSSLCIHVDDNSTLVAVDNPSGIQFLGVLIHSCAKECNAMRAVHRLKDKVRLFAGQKQEAWNAGMVRIGKKWLAHGLKSIKESEIKQLGLSSPLLDKISHFRKKGMETDHWFKCLLKIWLQDINSKAETCEESVLSKYIAEPAVPQDLKDSFFSFQKRVAEYVSSESASVLALLSNFNENADQITITKVETPISVIKQKIVYYGMVNTNGFPRHVSALMLQDDILIIYWFSGLVRRWLKWYSEYDNFKDLKLLMVKFIKLSCIKTLAAKHRIHESLIEKQFEVELNSIPVTEDLEIDMASISSIPTAYEDDEALMYGISYSGLSMLSLARVEVPSQQLTCFAMGCQVKSPNIYTLHVKEKQKFPGWNTGFSAAIHLCLNGEKIVLCNRHVRDLYLGHISLQAIEFSPLRR